MKRLSALFLILLASQALALEQPKFYKVMDGSKVMGCFASHSVEPNWTEITTKEYLSLKDKTEEQKKINKKTQARERTIKEISRKLGISVEELKGVIE